LERFALSAAFASAAGTTKTIEANKNVKIKSFFTLKNPP
jgi:hypothetical protein